MPLLPVRRWRVPTLLLVALLVALVPTWAVAQSVVTADVQTLTVNGDRGASQQRQIVLTSTAAVSGITILVPQMVRADNRAALPLDAISATPPSTTIAAGERITIPLNVDLSRAEAGTYVGSLLVSYASGGVPSTLPVTLSISVKDPIQVPFLVLLAGVGLASLLSLYRAQGQPRDEQLVRLNRLRAQAAADRESMSGAWSAAFDRNMSVALLAITANRIDDARTKIDETENLLSTWVQGRTQWAALARRATDVRGALTQIGVPASAPFAQSLVAQIETAEATAVQSGDPAILQTSLNQYVDQINALAALRTHYDDAVRLRDQTLADKRLTARAPEYATRLAALRNQIDTLLPGGDTATPHATVDTIIAELDALPLPQQGGALLSGDGTPAAPAVPFVPSAPTVLAQLALATAKIEVPGTVTRGAAWRVRVFQLARFAIATIFLAGAGFSELYVNDAVFGDTAWGDYFSLLLWGFSAETSRAAITDLARNLGIPGTGGGAA